MGSATDTAEVTLDVPDGQPCRVPTPSTGDPRLENLSLNQRTTAMWNLREAIDGCLSGGVPSIGVWREPVAEVGLQTASAWLRESGLRVSSICRGGFFTSADPAAQKQAHEENLRALDETAELGAPVLVLVPGGLPDGDRDLSGARDRAVQAIARLAPEAGSRGVRLGIEPMNPIYAADRGVVSTLAQALEIAELFPVKQVGVVVDTFHLWWEPDVYSHVLRAAERITSYQVADWITPLPADTLLSRGMPGDGHVDFTAFTQAVTAAGYEGDIEFEIFNGDLWACDGNAVVDTIKRRFVELVQPHAQGSVGH